MIISENAFIFFALAKCLRKHTPNGKNAEDQLIRPHKKCNSSMMKITINQMREQMMN